LVSVNLSQFILGVVLYSAALCIRLRNVLRKWFVTTVLTLPTCSATALNFVRIFCNDSEAILSRNSALCPGGQTFLSETHLKQLTNHIHLVRMIQNIKISLANNLLRKKSKLPISLEQFLSFIAT